MEEGILDRISDSILNIEDSEEVKNLVSDTLLSGVPPLEIIERGIRKGLEEVGKKYSKGEYFLSELIYAGDLAKEIFGALEPEFGEGESEEVGTIVLGTVRGDIHDVGKNIFAMLAMAEGFNVVDLGTDIKPQTFVQNVQKHNADILGLSCLLTTTIPEIKLVIESLEDVGIRDKVKVIIGGNAVNDEVSEKVRADAAAREAFNGIKICKEWME